MKEMFAAMKDITLVEPLITIKGRMHSDDEPKLEALADSLMNDFTT